MLKFLCNELTVSFRNNRNQQRIRFSEGPSSAIKLLVCDDGQRLTVAFMNRQGAASKFIGFPMEIVSEYCIDEIDQPRPQPPATVAEAPAAAPSEVA